VENFVTDLLQIFSDICAPKTIKTERDLTKLLRKEKGWFFCLTVYILHCKRTRNSADADKPARRV